MSPGVSAQANDQWTSHAVCAVNCWLDPERLAAGRASSAPGARAVPMPTSPRAPSPDATRSDEPASPLEGLALVNGRVRAHPRLRGVVHALARSVRPEVGPAVPVVVRVVVVL